MAARWTLDEEQQLWNFVSEEYVEKDRAIHWKEVQKHLKEWGYQRSLEACRKHYNVMLDKNSNEIQEANESLGEFANILCESLKPMSESDWQVDSHNQDLNDTASEMEEISIDDKECEAEYYKLISGKPNTVWHEAEGYVKKEKRDIFSILASLTLIIIFLIFFSLNK
jgi:hypothetical protein